MVSESRLMVSEVYLEYPGTRRRAPVPFLEGDKLR